MLFYEPGEDSYTLLDALEKENLCNKVILEIGSSSGVISDYLRENNFVVSTDLNVEGLKINKNTCKVNTDLFKGIKQKKFDICVFNPPYIPNSECKQLGGGKDGTIVINRFLEDIKIPNLYLLVIRANKLKLNGEIIQVRRILNETIIIYRINTKDL